MGIENLTVVSFDIDGTLEMGDPPGPVQAGLVHNVRERGWIMGSCSDRTLREQTEMWERAGIAADFVVGKHRLEQIRERYGAGHPSPARFVHIGDTHMDAYFAALAGFEFFFAVDAARGLGLDPAVGLGEQVGTVTGT